jgi:hypothetical protein
MIGRWAALAFAIAGCGRVAFDPVDGDEGSGPRDFDRDFTRGQLRGITVQRASPASYVDANGVIRYAAANQARLDHDPVTRAPLGLLVESAATNRMVDSAALDSDVEWFSNGACDVSADAAMAPDGTMSADAVIDLDTVDHARRGIGRQIANDTQAYSFSVFARAGTRNTMSFGAEMVLGSPTVQTSMTVDLSTGAVLTPPDAVAVAYGVDPFADGWYRVWIAIENNASGNVDGILSVWSNREAIGQTGSVYAWGAQLEQRERPSSYIPTLSEPATRAADVVTSNGDWLAPDRGTLRVTADISVARSVNQPALCFGDATMVHTCLGRHGSSGTTAFTIIRGGSITLGGSPWPRATPRTVAIAWSDTGSTFWDQNPGGSTNLSLLETSLVRFGSDRERFLDGHLRRVTYHPERLPDDELTAFATAP